MVVGVHHVELRGLGLELEVHVVLHLHLALLSALGGDEDDAVGTARTVDGRR